MARGLVTEAELPAVRAKTSRWQHGWFVPYLFLAPALFFYVGFLVYPMLSSLWISFFDWDGLSPTKTFVGLDNYLKLFFNDEVARRALWNNVLWTIASLIVPTGLGLSFALALNRNVPGTTAFRAVFYSPAVLPLVAVGLIWSWMYNPQFGAVNVFLKEIGLGAIARGWLSDFNTALPAAFLTSVWANAGLPMVLYLAGLQSINREFYDAAKIDGAGPLQAFRHITLPGLSETHVIVLSLAVIQAFKVFDLIYVMTYGGPGQSTQVLGTWMYFQSFQYYHAGYGAAIAWVIAAIVLVIAVPYIRRMSRS